MDTRSSVCARRCVLSARRPPRTRHPRPRRHNPQLEPQGFRRSDPVMPPPDPARNRSSPAVDRVRDNRGCHVHRAWTKREQNENSTQLVSFARRPSTTRPQSSARGELGDPTFIHRFTGPNTEMDPSLKNIFSKKGLCTAPTTRAPGRRHRLAQFAPTAPRLAGSFYSGNPSRHPDRAIPPIRCERGGRGWV